MKITVSPLPTEAQPNSIWPSVRALVNFSGLEIRLANTRRNKARSTRTAGQRVDFRNDLPLFGLRMKIANVFRASNRFLRSPRGNGMSREIFR
jgi:hypothetical protein